MRPRIIRSRDRGNSPKNRLVEALAIALATGNAKAACSLLTEDAEWEIVGRGVVAGRARIAAILAKARPVRKVTIDRVLTHGRAGAVDGSIELTPTHTRRFCDVYDLSSARGTAVRRITSWDVRG